MYVVAHGYIAQLMGHGLAKEARYPKAASRVAFEEEQVLYEPIRNAAFAAAASVYKYHAKARLEDLDSDLDQLDSPLHHVQARPIWHTAAHLFILHFLILLFSILLPHAPHAGGIIRDLR
ncbi:hypothetical protein PG993_000780 [Apiospora rasikravindrae]|uniref:Uncharacterized protein n=1 Tax=Apiospora rasikravindrae TaxID=990691 RepID=A0ABR1U9I2_9PEZI